MAGKKGFPKYNKKAVNSNMYVSSYAKNQNHQPPKLIPQGYSNNSGLQQISDNQYATADEQPHSQSFNSNFHKASMQNNKMMNQAQQEYGGNFGSNMIVKNSYNMGK